MLNATVEKYKSSASSQIIVQEVPVSNQGQTSQQSTGNSGAGNSNTSTNENDGGEEEPEFSPDTVTTPEEGIEPEVELDVTVIDISE